MQVQRVQNNHKNFTFSGLIQGLTLKNEIAKLKNPTKEMVKDLYGSFGLDIYEGKKKLTIIYDTELKKSKSIMSRMKNLLMGNKLQDFEESDTLSDVLNKFIENKGNGFVKDIETMFGKKGLAKLEDTDINIHTFNFNDIERFVKVV